MILWLANADDLAMGHRGGGGIKDPCSVSLTVALITLAVSYHRTVTGLRHRHLHTYSLALCCL